MTDIQTAAPAPETEWVACRQCKALLYLPRFSRNLRVCPECGHHAPLTALERVDQLMDRGSSRKIADPPVVADPLGFTDSMPYTRRHQDAVHRTGLREAVYCVQGRIRGKPVIAAVMDFRFMGGSLGSAVGELIVTAAEMASRDHTPLLLVTASGGARMQEGILSLMQMAKTAQALAALDQAGVLTITLITDPTFGGVAASFATLTDVILAEPGARMGFAGPRVIEQTLRQTLPKGFQSAEFLLEHGLIDDVVPRASLRSVLATMLAAPPPPEDSGDPPVTASSRADGLPWLTDPERIPSQNAWDTVQLARHIDRPTTLDYVSHLMEGFHELRGDRVAGDCSAIVGGLARLDGRAVMVIGHQKGHSTSELIARNFGMARPEGYRKAARLMRLAAKLRLPVLALVDTPGAHPGIEAEERGQAIAIAENLRLMCELPVPIITVVTGEGGSGGALALGVADRVFLCANAIYSVISPEGCAAILWNDRSAAPEAAAALRLSAGDLLRLGIIDGVIPEPAGGSHRDTARAAELLHQALTAALIELSVVPVEELGRQRRKRFREFGWSPQTEAGEP